MFHICGVLRIDNVIPLSIVQAIRADHSDGAHEGPRPTIMEGGNAHQDSPGDGRGNRENDGVADVLEETASQAPRGLLRVEKRLDDRWPFTALLFQRAIRTIVVIVT